MDITEAFRAGATAPYTVYVNKYSHDGSGARRIVGTFGSLVDAVGKLNEVAPYHQRG